MRVRSKGNGSGLASCLALPTVRGKGLGGFGGGSPRSSRTSEPPGMELRMHGYTGDVQNHGRSWRSLELMRHHSILKLKRRKRNESWTCSQRCLHTTTLLCSGPYEFNLQSCTCSLRKRRFCHVKFAKPEWQIPKGSKYHHNTRIYHPMPPEKRIQEPCYEAFMYTLPVHRPFGFRFPHLTEACP